MSKQITEKESEIVNDFASDYDALKKGFAQLRDDVSDLVNTVAGAGRHGASNVLGSVKEQISDLRKKGADSAASIEDAATEHPVYSALILVGLGFLAASVLRRR